MTARCDQRAVRILAVAARRGRWLPRAGVRLGEPALGADGSAWWLERRPQESGRTALVRDGEDVTPPEFNVRTRVHEYGGGAWLLHGDTVFFSHFDDQRLYRLDPGGAPFPITPEGPLAATPTAA